MRSTIAALFVAALASLASTAAADTLGKGTVAAALPRRAHNDNNAMRGVARRHHHKAKRCRVPTRSSSAAGSSSANATASAATSVVSSVSNSTSSSSSASTVSVSGIAKNGIVVGMLPDDGSGGGSANTMAELVSAIGGSKIATMGLYAQAVSGTTFDGSQLLDRIDDILASGAILEAAVMPTGGWEGLTTDDNSQAVAIADVMYELIQKGVPEVRLRFAHEANFYQTDGTYTGTATDFKEGWAVVAAAVKAKCGSTVSMFWTPNIASASVYAEYAPDMTTVDLVGIDYYPDSLTDTTFFDAFQDFHDTYTSDSISMTLGETGLGFAGTAAERVAWLTQITADEVVTKMPKFLGGSWFNYQKGYDFKLIDTSASSTTTAFTSYMGIS